MISRVFSCASPSCTRASCRRYIAFTKLICRTCHYIVVRYKVKLKYWPAHTGNYYQLTGHTTACRLRILRLSKPFNSTPDAKSSCNARPIARRSLLLQPLAQSRRFQQWLHAAHRERVRPLRRLSVYKEHTSAAEHIHNDRIHILVNLSLHNCVQSLSSE